MFNCGLERRGEAGRRSFISGRRGRKSGGRGGGGGRTAAEDTDSRQRRADGGVAALAATMRPHCWMVAVLAVMMSSLAPERALGVPQREGERSRWWWGFVENLSVMLMKG